VPGTLDLKALWTDGKAFGATLLAVLAHEFGQEAVDEWLPDTRLLALEERYNMAIPQLVFDRLEAAIAIVTTDRFTRSLPDFIALCNVLNGDLYDPNTWDPAEVDEMCWAVLESAVIWPPTNDSPEDELFSDEIALYMGQRLDAEGFIQTPILLSMAQRDPAAVAVAQENLDADPDLAAMTLQLQTDKMTELNAWLHARLIALVTQLAALPIESMAEYADNIFKSVKGLIGTEAEDGESGEETE